MKHFKLNDIVRVSKENDNKNYNNFRGKILVVVDIVKSSAESPAFDEGMKGQYLYSFKDLKGKDIPCSLYDYELERI